MKIIKTWRLVSITSLFGDVAFKEELKRTSVPQMKFSCENAEETSFSLTTKIRSE